MIDQMLIFLTQSISSGLLWDNIKSIFGEDKIISLKEIKCQDEFENQLKDLLQDKRFYLFVKEMYDEHKEPKKINHVPLEEYAQWLEIRSSRVLGNLDDLNIKDKNILRRKFLDLHKKHIKAIEDKKYVIAYEILSDIFTLSNDLQLKTSPSNKGVLHSRIGDNSNPVSLIYDYLGKDYNLESWEWDLLQPEEVIEFYSSLL